LLFFRDGLSQVCGLLPQAQVGGWYIKCHGATRNLADHADFVAAPQRFSTLVMPANEIAPGEPGALDRCDVGRGEG
jgi:hypothetical protein